MKGYIEWQGVSWLQQVKETSILSIGQLTERKGINSLRYSLVGRGEECSGMNSAISQISKYIVPWCVFL